MWKSILLSFIAGLLFTVAWPTYGFPLFLFVAFVPLLLIERQFSQSPFKRKASKIFFLGLLSFFVWNALSYSWLRNAHPQFNPTVEQLSQAWFAYGFAVVVNALLMATVFLLFHKIRHHHGDLYGYVFLPSAWLCLEVLHMNWDFAWPWLNLGNGFAAYHQWVQWYSVTGVAGGTVWVFLVNIFLFFAIINYLEQKRKKIKMNIIAALGMAMLPIALSLWMYYSYQERQEKTMKVVLLQPKLDPYYEKYNHQGSEILKDLLDLMEESTLPSADFVVAPETAFPGRENVLINNLEKDDYILQVKQKIEEYPTLNFLSGVDAIRLTHSQQTPNATAIPLEEGLWANRYNAVVQINNKDSVKDYYKSKLVVGVELFPYMSVLKPLLGNAMLDFGGSVNSLTTQPEREVFENSFNAAKVAPLVCYESIFGEYVSTFVKKGANIISISTNDSWWGNTEGHKQLLYYAKLRAIENRRDIMRSANSGVSAIINQRGDIVKQLPYDVRGTLKGEVNLNSELTPYTRSGDVLSRIALIVTAILLAYHFVDKLKRWGILKK